MSVDLMKLTGGLVGTPTSLDQALEHAELIALLTVEEVNERRGLNLLVEPFQLSHVPGVQVRKTRGTLVWASIKVKRQSEWVFVIEPSYPGVNEGTVNNYQDLALSFITVLLSIGV